MKIKAVSGIMLTLLLIGLLTLEFNVQPVKASGTIYIRADGSVDPPGAPISSVDNITYIFTADIYDSIVVERDNIVVDGAGYTVEGPAAEWGIYLSQRENVTIRNAEIKVFTYGIYLDGSSLTSIYGNNITNNGDGIKLSSSSGNSIFGNNITNSGNGIYFMPYSNYNSISGNNITNNSNGIYFWASHYMDSSSDNSISGNNITANSIGIYLMKNPKNNMTGNNIENNGDGIYLWHSFSSTISGNTITANNGDGIYLRESSHTIYGNNITNNSYGVYLHWSVNNTVSGNNIANNNGGVYLGETSNNTFYYNSFIDNTLQVNITAPGYANFWDDGYPSGGNYWSDYSDVDLHCGPNQDIPGRDGIWDNPYVIDENNTDRYPLVNPYVPGNLSVSIYTDKYTYHAGDTMHLGLNVSNPDSVKYLRFAIWVELPDSSIYVYMHKHSVVLPIGTDYSNPNFETITLPSIPSGNYTWHVAFLKRATHTIMVEDTAEWEFV